MVFAKQKCRQYALPEQEIEASLIHRNYVSQKDIEVYLDFDLASFADHTEFDSTRTLHETLKSNYGAEDEHGAAAQQVAA